MMKPRTALWDSVYAAAYIWAREIPDWSRAFLDRPVPKVPPIEAARIARDVADEAVAALAELDARREG